MSNHERRAEAYPLHAALFLLYNLGLLTLLGKLSIGLLKQEVPPVCLTLPIIFPNWSGQISLCPGSLQKLEEILWLTDASARQAELHALLQIDPALSLFLAAELLPDEKFAERNLAGLAEIAAPRLSVILAPDLGLATSSDLVETIAESASHAVMVSNVVLRLAERHQCADPAAFHLAAHLLGAVDLIITEDPALPTKQIRDLISDWLVEACHLPEVLTFCSITETLLAEAANSEHQRNAPSSASAELLSDCLQLAERVTAHGQKEAPNALASLQRLVLRIAPLEELQLEFSSRLETEKLLAMKELAYGAGHEINNPLANISVRAQTLIKQEQDPERKRMLAAINGQVYRAHEMIADLMLFAQPPQMTPAPTELIKLLNNLVKELQPDAQRQNTELSFQPTANEIHASADPLQLSLALHAMVINSLEAIGRGGKIELAAQQISLAKGRRQAKIILQDDGPGITPEIRRHLFDPFYSGREAGRGLGFGLSKCWRIVTAHAGQIEVDRSPLGGAMFTITLPLEVSQSPAATSAEEIRRTG